MKEKHSSQDRINRELVLYSFRRCPFAIRARMSIYYSTIKCQIREISLKNKPAEFISLSPKATVPVLLKEDLSVIEESLDIVKWILGQSDPSGLLIPLHDENEDVDYFVSLFDNKFKFHLDRYKYSSRYDVTQKQKHRDSASEILKLIDDKITESGFIYGNKISVYELCILPLVRQFMIADPRWFEEHFKFEKVKKSLQVFTESQAFKVTMKKYDEWIDDKNKIQYFPILE
ncbi:MAG: glutathione S-transferase [Rhodobiaceae bacterium]|nr:glutathione S-transferase [Rhodobiaceae bacterium]